MRTIVIQSYRTTHIERWIQRCMQTVQEWATNSGYEYEFIDDALFEYVPRQLRDKSSTSLLPLTDIARLGVLQERLASAYDRAIWLDADVVIFRPDQLRIPAKSGASLCHEIWSYTDAQGQVHHRRGINNAAMVFDRGHPLLGFLHHAALELYGHLEPTQIRTTTLGTDFLSKLGRLYPMRLLTQVACLSHLLVHALSANQQPELLQEHAKRFGHPFHAANLCRSKLKPAALSDASRQTSLDADKLYDVVEMLIATEGETLCPTHRQ